MTVRGCIVIEGPKWCGKSTTAKRFAKTIIELQEPSVYEEYKLFAETGSKNLLAGERPILFDEWQKIPELWDYIRAEIDRNGGRGQFFLTGSAKPTEDKNRHSGVGRIVKMKMRTMSLWESMDSIGSVSMEELFEGKKEIDGKNDQDIDRMAFLICRGGWPDAVMDEDEIALQSSIDYVDELLSEDITKVDEIRRNPVRARAILRAYARNISTPARMPTIQNDIEANDAVLDTRTLDSYITAFEKLFVIDDVEAWSPSLRSKTAIRTTNIRQFTDPSIATAVLDIGPNDLVRDPKTFGLMFEAMAIRDLRAYAECIGGKVFQYHDADGLEADAVIHLKNGKWGAAEVKIGGAEKLDEAAKNLLKLREKVNVEKMSEPVFLMIVTGTQHAYKRPDGVLVVPIGCLKN